MCQYRRTIYQCNHAMTSTTPLQTCEEHTEFEEGRKPIPCTNVDSHPRVNVRVPQLCDACHESKEQTDKLFQSIKSRLGMLRNELRRHNKCLDEEELRARETSKAAEAARIDSCINDLTAVEEFLKGKMEEEHAHMMMLWDHR